MIQEQWSLTLNFKKNPFSSSAYGKGWYVACKVLLVIYKHIIIVFTCNWHLDGLYHANNLTQNSSNLLYSVSYICMKVEFSVYNDNVVLSLQ